MFNSPGAVIDVLADMVVNVPDDVGIIVVAVTAIAWEFTSAMLLC